MASRSPTVAHPLLLLAIAISASGCPDDGDVAAETDSASSSSDATTGSSGTESTSPTGASADASEGATADTSADGPSSSDGDEDESDAGSTGSGSGASSSDSSDSGASPCGNGEIDPGEVCDGDALAGADCTTLGWLGGTLGCALDCSSYDESTCNDLEGCCVQHITPNPGCSDPACEQLVCAVRPECCDVMWDSSCSTDTAYALCDECTQPDICGNQIVDGADECDWYDLGGTTCADLGFDGGFLSCQPDCTFQTGGCQFFDGDCCSPNLTPGCEDIGCAGDVCATYPHCCEQWGDDCVALALGICPICGGGMGGDCCSASGGQGCADAGCTAAVCAEQPFGQGEVDCCVLGWDLACADLATSVCGACGICGDGIVLDPEACDGPDLGGQTCVTQGFVSGALACDATCQLDTSACIANGGGDCCVADATPGCDDATCTTDVCFADATCCSGAWGDACANLAASLCTVCGGTPPTFPCADEDIGSAIGAAVATGDTSTDDDDLGQSCDLGGGADHVMLWTAPFAGTFVADTVGSGYDTSLSIHTSCNSEYACDDDSGGGGAASIMGFVPAGEPLLISVTGAPGTSGAWVLNITAI